MFYIYSILCFILIIPQICIPFKTIVRLLHQHKTLNTYVKIIRIVKILNTLEILIVQLYVGHNKDEILGKLCLKIVFKLYN